jgi:hypothetical protein
MSILVGWICIEGIALILRKEPGLVRDLAERLRSKFATARSAAAVGDNEREWYIILTLCSPLQVIRLLEDSGERAVRLREKSPFVSLLSDLGREGFFKCQLSQLIE